MKSIAVFLTILLGIVAAWAIAWEGGTERPARPVYQLAEGDIVFQANISPQHEAIRQATGSPYTHCGVVFRRGGKLMVYMKRPGSRCVRRAASATTTCTLRRWPGSSKNGMDRRTVCLAKNRLSHRVILLVPTC